MRWHKNLRNDFGGKPGHWAYAESPLIDGDKLVCTPGGKKATIVALNKKNGDVIWKCAVPGGDEAAYASAIVVEVGGIKQYVQFLAKGLGRRGRQDRQVPVALRQNGQGEPGQHPHAGGPRRLRLQRAGQSRRRPGQAEGRQGRGRGRSQSTSTQNLPNAHRRRRSRSATICTAPTGNGLQCVEFTTGKVKWQDKSLGAGSVCYADGRLYIHGENGAVVLVEATPDGYHEKGRFTPPDQPALAGMARRGRTPSSQTAGCTSATWACCGASTSRMSKGRSSPSEPRTQRSGVRQRSKRPVGKGGEGTSPLRECLRRGGVSPPSPSPRLLGLLVPFVPLVPKLCLGTQVCEALLRVQLRGRTRNGVSRTGVPKQSLGTRGTRGDGVWERGSPREIPGRVEETDIPAIPAGTGPDRREAEEPGVRQAAEGCPARTGIPSKVGARPGWCGFSPPVGGPLRSPPPSERRPASAP